MSKIKIASNEKSYEDGLWDGVRFGCGLSLVIAVVILIVLGLGYLVGMG